MRVMHQIILHLAASPSCHNPFLARRLSEACDAFDVTEDFDMMAKSLSITFDHTFRGLLEETQSGYLSEHSVGGAAIERLLWNRE